jgi:hypothetical protein
MLFFFRWWNDDVIIQTWEESIARDSLYPAYKTPVICTRENQIRPFHDQIEYRTRPGQMNSRLVQQAASGKCFERFLQIFNVESVHICNPSGFFRYLKKFKFWPHYRCCGLAAWFPQMIWQMLMYISVVHSCYLSYRGRIPRLSLAFWAPGTSRTALVDRATRVANMCRLNNPAYGF